MARVAVIKTTPQTVLKDYARLMHMAGYEGCLSKEKKTILIPNLSWREWFPAASTEPWQLEGVLKTLLKDGFDRSSVYVMEESQPGVDTLEALRFNGLDTAAKREGVAYARLGEEDARWVPFCPAGELMVLDRLFGEEGIPVPEIFLGNDIIHLPTVKTHARARIAGAAMSAFDSLLDEEWTQGDIHSMLVDLLELQKEVCAAVFTVTDGTICGDGPGPRTITPYIKNYILAGSDPVAVDAVMAHMMGFDPMEIEYIRLATEREVGMGDIRRITVEGEDISQIDFHFTGGGSALVGGSSAYLDYFWYPFRGWRHVGRMAETEWGQLLQDYLPAGAELEHQGKGKAPVLALAAAAALLGLGASRRVARMGRRSA